MTVYIAALLVFLCVAGLAYVALDTTFSEERAVSRRLKRLSEYERTQAQEIEPLLKPFRERVLVPTVSGLKSVGRLLGPAAHRAELKRRLRTAGNPRNMDAERFIALQVIGAAGVLGLFITISLVVPLTMATWLIIVLPLVALAFFSPELWLRGMVADRKRRIVNQLPDMLDMLTISVEAGLGFDAALSKLVRNSKGPLAEEFARALKEIQAGVDRRHALRNLAERTDVPLLNTFIMSIIQAEMFGISISGVLKTQAREMRLKRRQRAEEQAQKAPVKLVFPLVFCILPTTLIVVLGPAVISIAKAFAGR